MTGNRAERCRTPNIDIDPTVVTSNMALLLQRLFRSQQSPQQLLHLQGGCALSGLREFSAAAPDKAKSRGLGSSRAEGTAPRFYKYVGVEPAPGQVCVHPTHLRA